MKKIVGILSVILIFSIVIGVNNVYADAGVDSIISAMDGTQNAVSASGTRTGNVINNVIGIMQVVGTGISLIVITILGIKYIIASPGEKADVKKAIMPIGIGCILLFGAVNLMAALEDFAPSVLNNS
jgi:hypothetical protein